MMLRYLLKSVMLPPLLQLLGLLVAVVIWRLYPRLARTLALLSIASLWMLATPWVSDQLILSLENEYPLKSPQELQQTDAQAIVILSGTMVPFSREFGASAVSSSTLLRLRYGAFLHRQTDLPILVTGGTPYSNSPVSLAIAMAHSLEQHFQVDTRWLEKRSRTTAENAQFSAAILADEGIEHVLLVTEGYHMPRAVYSFEKAGLEVTAAPTSNLPPGGPSLKSWIPSSLALHNSSIALHEYLGLLAYKWGG